MAHKADSTWLDALIYENTCINKEMNSHLNAVEAKYMTTAHMMWKNWCLIAFSTLTTISENHTSAATVLLLP
jgi:hypothetical protein